MILRKVCENCITHNEPLAEQCGANRSVKVVGASKHENEKQI
jgi:hypothetical protein